MTVAERLPTPSDVLNNQLIARLEEMEREKAELAEENARLWKENERLRKGEAA